MEGLTQAIKLLTERFDGPMEVGDTDYLVCNDGIVIIEMDEFRTLKVNVIAGEPTVADINLGLLEEDGDDDSDI